MEHFCDMLRDNASQQLRGRTLSRNILTSTLSSVSINIPAKVLATSATYIIVFNALNCKKKRRWCMRNILMRRDRIVNIVSDLHMSDGSFVNFTRMSTSDFESLLQMIGPSIAKQDTIFRIWIFVYKD